MASTSEAQSLDLDRILDERIDWRYKSFPAKPATTIRDVRKRGWNLLDGEFHVSNHGPEGVGLAAQRR